MKKRFFAFLITLLGLTHNSDASTYYLSSSSGDDNYSGLYPDSAWLSLDKLNSITLFPGDSVLLKCDDTFYGTIIISNSGSFSLPIYFGKFGTGSLPVITGFKKLTGFSQIGNIFSVQDTSFVRSIWLNGKWMQPARYPNKGFISTLSLGVNNIVYNNLLNQQNGYWDNSTVAIRSSGIKYEMSLVDTFLQGAAILSQPTQYLIPQFSGFFFYNKFAELDTINEWYCDTLNNSVNIIPPSGISINIALVEASILDYGFYAGIDASNLVIEGIEFNGQAKDAIHFQGLATGIKIQNNHFKKCKERAIAFKQTTLYCQLINNKIEDCSGDGVFSEFFFHCRIENNVISRIGLQEGFGLENTSQGIGLYLYGAIYDTIINNIIDSCGYGGITLFNKYNRIENNFLNHCMLKLNGGGAMIFYNMESNYNYISKNFILNTNGNIDGTTLSTKTSFGIYFADNIRYDSVIHNTIINSDSYGIYIGPNNHNHFFIDNVLYNNQKGQVFINDGNTTNSTYQIKLQKNIFYSLSDKQKGIQFAGKNYNFFPIKGDSNYYCNPYDYFPIYQQIDFDTIIRDRAFPLADWRLITSQDSNSHVSKVDWQNYYVTDTTGLDLVENGNFSNNFDGWNAEPVNNNMLLLDNLTMMDGGCVKFKITDTIPNPWAKIVSNDFALQTDQFYQVSFSSSGLIEGILHSDIKQQHPPYNPVGFDKFFPNKSSRVDYNNIFSSSQYDSPLALNFELSKSDSLVYFDNIHLFPVSVFKHDSTRMSVLIMNYSPNIVSVPLGADSIFRDLDGNIVTGSYSLNPYSSYVLVLDSPLNLVKVKEIQSQINSIKVFPNPVQSYYGNVNVQLPDSDKYHYEVHDLMGRKILEGQFSGLTNNVVSLKNTAAGVYILTVHSSNKIWQQKIVVVN